MASYTDLCGAEHVVEMSWLAEAVKRFAVMLLLIKKKFSRQHARHVELAGLNVVLRKIVIEISAFNSTLPISEAEVSTSKVWKFQLPHHTHCKAQTISWNPGTFNNVPMEMRNLWTKCQNVLPAQGKWKASSRNFRFPQITINMLTCNMLWALSVFFNFFNYKNDFLHFLST